HFRPPNCRVLAQCKTRLLFSFRSLGHRPSPPSRIPKQPFPRVLPCTTLLPSRLPREPTISIPAHKSLAQWPSPQHLLARISLFQTFASHPAVQTFSELHPSFF